MGDNPYVSDRPISDKNAPDSDTNLLNAFTDSFKSALTMPVIGTKQLLGNEDAAKSYFQSVSGADQEGAEKYASNAGALFGSAAVFIGTTMLAKRIPFFGKAAPIAAGAALGFVEPLHDGQGSMHRLAHAGLGAATVSILEYGPKRLPGMGMKTMFGEEMAKIGVSGVAAGMLNTEAQSLLNTGKLVSLQDAVMGGVAWGLTGMAFHGAGTGLSKLRPLGIGTPRDGQVYVIGSRYSEECFAARDFLQKNYIPFKVYDPEKSFFARRLLNAATKDAPPGNHTMMILPGGKSLLCPEPFQLAESLGMKTKPGAAAYDTIVVGAGPAGLQASIYGTSEGLRTLMIDSRGPGGQAGTTSRIENVMGFENGISGPELMSRAFQQTKRLGTEFILNEAKGLRRAEDGTLFLTLRDGTEVGARSVVLATGVQFRQIGEVPNLAALEGKGVYYGSALTEAPLTKPGEHVYIVGGANSAGQAAVKYSELVGPTGEVVMLTRSPLNKSMSDYLIDQINARPNIRVETGAVLEGVAGSAKLESVSFLNQLTGAKSTEAANSMFVFIGSVPKTHWLSEQLAVDSQGFLQTGLKAKQRSAWNLDRDPMPNETSIPGVFTAGDVHSGTAKRIITAAGEGANTVSQIHQWLGTPNAAKPMYDRGPLAAAIAPKVTADIPALWPAPELNPNLGILRMSGLWAQYERTRAGVF